MIEEIYERYSGMLTEEARRDAQLKETIAKYLPEASRPSKAVASRFVMAFRRYLLGGKDKWMLTEAGDGLRVWNGQYYEKVDKPRLFMRELSRRVMERLNAAPVHQEFTSGLIASGVMDSLMATDAYRFKPDRRYIAMRNGILDLKGDGQKGGWVLKDFLPSRQTDLVLDFDYLAPGEARIVKVVGEENSELYSLWAGKDNKKGKIAEILPQEEVRNCFQEFCGSVLCGRDEFRTEYLCLLMGPGSNGKSVAVNAIAGVFGEEYVGRYSLEQLFRGDRRDRYVADLNGKVINIADDISAKGFDSGDFKKMISGDGVGAMKAYATDPIKVRIPPVLGCCNAMPEVKDDSWGYHRRVLQLSAGGQFGSQTSIKRDPRLLATLKQDPCRLAILHWMLEGRRRFMRANGEIEVPEDVKRATEIQMEESSPHRLWLRECGYAPANRTTEENGTWIPISGLFEEYSRWCVMGGYDKRDMGNRTGLSKFLRREGYRPEKMRGGTMHYLMSKLMSFSSFANPNKDNEGETD